MTHVAAPARLEPKVTATTPASIVVLPPDGTPGHILALQRADRRKDQFLATLAHELRTPLAAISCATALIDSQSNAAATHQAVQLIDRSVQHMTRLIADLLDVPAIVAGHLELRLERVDLCLSLRDALATVEQEFRQRNLRLTVEIPNLPIWLQGDASRLQQIFVNLLSNAAKYTQEGGAVRLGAERSPGTACIRIRDNGIGIDAAALPRLFELFFQAVDPVQRGRKGYGIGLAVVASLVAAHGGRVGVQSPGRGRGSEFTVHLPCS